MNKAWMWSGLVMALGLVGCGAPQHLPPDGVEPETPRQSTWDREVARFVEAMEAGECAAFHAQLSDTLRAKVSPKAFDGLCRKVLGDHGRVDRWTIVKLDGERRFYTLEVGQERWTLMLSTAQEGLVTGLSVKPVKARAKVVVPDAPILPRWPLGAMSCVMWGGDSVKTNRHAVNVQQRRALDIASCPHESPDGGKPQRFAPGTDGSRNEDYPIYGAPVLAAAAGTVHVVIDGIEDNTPGRRNTYVAPGNLVIVQHGPEVFAWYAHLQPGSVAVKPGQKVTAGQRIGLVGNSGRSTEPHLHFHLQDKGTLGQGKGLGVTFQNVLVQTAAQDVPFDVGVYRPTRADKVTPQPPIKKVLNGGASVID